VNTSVREGENYGLPDQGRALLALLDQSGRGRNGSEEIGEALIFPAAVDGQRQSDRSDSGYWPSVILMFG
jgi:hypothetical protein